MSSIKMKNVSLDYIVKTGSDSIKKVAIQVANKALRKNARQTTSINNSTYRALNNINLDIKKGDRIGILGKNGAGKSTLLRVMAKIYKPTHGDCQIDGQISNLFNVDLGMNIEATGYENIINLAILRGVSKKEALGMIEDVERFTELGDFLNHPVRTYSAGMRMKLAFAVGTAISSEILLIDEVIGVGDFHFMKKATERLEMTIETSNILVLTSHSNDTVKRFCNKALVLDKGEIQYFGDIDKGIDLYQSSS